MALNFELNPPLGIDLGTTFSAIARWNGSEADAYQIGSNYTFQSVVWFDEENKKYLTDRIAYRRTLIYPEKGIIGVKRKMDNRDEKIILGTKEHSPIEISAKILEQIYGKVVDKFPNGQFKSRGVVVTVPYYFKAHQILNTREAAQLAGLNCIGILQEPIAASLQYVLQMVRDYPKEERKETMLVFDLGGGTLDLTLFNLQQTPSKLTFEVLATAGDDRLGGLDFDQCLMDYVLQQEKLSLDKLDELTQRRAKQKLLERACQVKEALSFEEECQFSVADVLPGRHIDRSVTRDEFISSIKGYMDRIESCLDDLFARSPVKKNDVTRVIKVGGSSQIPALNELLNDTIGMNKIFANINQDLCVAEGAAIYAAYLDDPEVFDRKIEITTRTCHALGIEIEDGRFYELVSANRKTPCTVSQIVTPQSSNQTEVCLNVYQGSSRFVKDNTKIGTILLPLDTEQTTEHLIKVTFKLDREQVLTVIVEYNSALYTKSFHSN